MTEYEIIILGFALSLDALIVSICYGLIICNSRLKNSLIFALSFGFFQFLMPVLGWNFTGFIYSLLEKYSKWIVFAIFAGLGCKFLMDVFSNEEKKDIKCISLFCILTLAIATSIDAFGAGVSLRFLNVPVIRPSLEIGLITFILSFVGFWAFGLFKKLPAQTVYIIGAVLLFYLAVKSLL